MTFCQITRMSHDNARVAMATQEFTPFRCHTSLSKQNSHVPHAYERFYSKFLVGCKTPNGCPILMTHFVSHNNTDFALAEDQFSAGHEIAEHSSLMGATVSELAEI